MLYTKIQPEDFLVLEKKILSVLPYMGMAAILFSAAEPFVQIVNNPSTEGPMWNLVKTGQAVSEKKAFQDNTILYMSIAHEEG